MGGLIIDWIMLLMSCEFNHELDYVIIILRKLFVLVLALHSYRETYRIVALYHSQFSIGLGALQN